MADPAFETELANAEAADLSLFEGKNIVTVLRTAGGARLQDKDGNALVMLMPSMIPRESECWEKSFQLFLKETEEVCCS